MEPTFKLEETDDKGRFYLNDENDQTQAEIKFTKDPNSVIQVTHTFVDPSLRGMGLAAKLVDTIVDHARKHNLKIVPVCPYVKKRMRSEDQYGDVLAK